VTNKKKYLRSSHQRCAAEACPRPCSRACISARQSAPRSSHRPSAALRRHAHAHAHARASLLAKVPHAQAIGQALRCGGMPTPMLTRVHLCSPKFPSPSLKPSAKRCAVEACPRPCSRACISARQSAPRSSHNNFLCCFYLPSLCCAVQCSFYLCDGQPSGRLMHRRFLHFKISNRLLVIAFVIHWERKFLGISNSCPKDADKRNTQSTGS
jgi:hypothetical protein